MAALVIFTPFVGKQYKLSFDIYSIISYSSQDIADFSNLIGSPLMNKAMNDTIFLHFLIWKPPFSTKNRQTRLLFSCLTSILSQYSAVYPGLSIDKTIILCDLVHKSITHS